MSDNNDDVMLIGGLDQDTLIEGHKEVLKVFEREIRESIDAADLERATQVCMYLSSIGKVAGLALAQSLYLMARNWEVFEIDEPIHSYIQRVMGIHPHTLDRYIRVVRMQTVIPTQFRDTIRRMNIKSQVPIANALDQGWEIAPSVWQRLSSAPDESTVREILRSKVKGSIPRKSSLRLWLDTNGTLWAFKGPHERYFVGSLEITAKEPAIQQAIRRLIQTAPIMTPDNVNLDIPDIDYPAQDVDEDAEIDE